MGSTERPETKERIMKTNHPLAQAVANEIGCNFCWLNAEHTEAEIDCTAADFAEFLPDVEGRAPSNFNRAAYDRLQNEGNSDKRSPRDPADEFDAGRE
jgi:hypothetical protein